MKFNFEIQEFPQNTSSYNVPAFTEGRLSITFGKDIFLQVDGILLVELAIVLSKWLQIVNDGRIEDFLYDSMDFEESPILKFTVVNGTKVVISSVWQIYPNQEIDLEKVIIATKAYIRDLTLKVKELYNFDLEKKIQENLNPATSLF